MASGKWRVPDWYIQAVSGGIGPIAIHAGFEQLLEMGLIERLPKFGVLQSEGCSPMVAARQANSGDLIDRIRARPEFKRVPLVVLTAKSLTPDESAFFAHHSIQIWPKTQLDRKALIAFVDKTLQEIKEEQ